MFCPKCGTKLSDDAKFCASCGAPTNFQAPVNNAQNVFESPANNQAQNVFGSPANNQTQNVFGSPAPNTQNGFAYNAQPNDQPTNWNPLMQPKKSHALPIILTIIGVLLVIGIGVFVAVLLLRGSADSADEVVEKSFEAASTGDMEELKSLVIPLYFDLMDEAKNNDSLQDYTDFDDDAFLSEIYDFDDFDIPFDVKNFKIDEVIEADKDEIDAQNKAINELGAMLIMMGADVDTDKYEFEAISSVTGTVKIDGDLCEFEYTVVCIDGDWYVYESSIN